MSVTITPLFPLVAFPWELDTITFTSPDAESVAVALELNGTVLYEETLFFGSDNRVDIEDVAGLIMDACDAGIGVLRLMMDGEYVSNMTSFIVPCHVVTDLPALRYVDESFMTLLSGAKQVPPDATERVAFYSAQGNEEAVATLTFSSSSEGMYRVSASLGTFGQVQQMVGIPLSLVDLCRHAHAEDDRLLRVKVAVGKREQEYVVNHSLRHRLCFRNAFHEDDVMYFSELECDVKPTRSSGMVNGKQRAFHVERNTTFKGVTAPLLDSELAWAEDAAHSLHFTDADGREVAVVDNEFKHTTNAADMPRLRLSWKNTQDVYKLHRKVHTFDTTFDPTYL